MKQTEWDGEESRAGCSPQTGDSSRMQCDAFSHRQNPTHCTIVFLSSGSSLTSNRLCEDPNSWSNMTWRCLPNWFTGIPLNFYPFTCQAWMDLQPRNSCCGHGRTQGTTSRPGFRCGGPGDIYRRLLSITPHRLTTPRINQDAVSSTQTHKLTAFQLLPKDVSKKPPSKQQP